MSTTYKTYVLKITFKDMYLVKNIYLFCMKAVITLAICTHVQRYTHLYAHHWSHQLIAVMQCVFLMLK